MITTIKIEHTEAKIVRCVAKKDLPAYGLKEGQVFYCAKSKSLGNNVYHILQWNYQEVRWNCPCSAKVNYLVTCHHVNDVSKDCRKPHVVQGYKPLSKTEKFDTLRQLYDVRFVEQREPIAA